MELVHSTQKRDDNILLEELRRGSKAAFEKLYHRFWDKLYLAAYHILHDREVSEDIVQEIFIQLWVRRESQVIHNLEAYLYMAVRFQVFRCLNDRKCKNDLVNGLAEFPADFFDEHLSYKEIESAMKNGIRQLPKKCGIIFSLSRQEQLSNKEIAHRLNISVKTVENQMSIAIKKMRKHLAPWLLHVFLIALLDIFR